MKNQPRRSRRASRCTECQADVRRGHLIVFTPADAQPGEPRNWIHAECAR